jgi:transposase-like protein
MPKPSRTTARLSAQLQDPETRAKAISEVARVAALDLPMAQVAAQLGVPERTLLRWRAEDAELRAAVEGARGRVGA